MHIGLIAAPVSPEMTKRGEHPSALLMLYYTACQKICVGLANINAEVKGTVKTMKTSS